MAYSHKIVVILFVLSFHLALFAQNEESKCYEINNPYIISEYKSAREQAATSPLSSYQKLAKAVKIQPKFAAAYYLMGEIDYQRAINLQNSENPIARPEFYFSKAVKNFQKVINTCDKTENYGAYYYLGEYYFDTKDYYQAKDYLSTFMSKNSTDYELLKQSTLFLKKILYYDSLISHPVIFNPQRVLDASTPLDEYLPLLSPDGELLFFTRKIYKQSAGYIPELSEEFIFSERIENDTVDIFSVGESMPYPFNKGLHQGGASITIDNNQLFITICNPIRMDNTSYKNCDIYVTERINGKWTEFKNLGGNINAENTWEAQPTVTADGKVLFFASSREGGFGGIDIYQSVKDTSGNWGKAFNLGPVINTPGDDKTPFIHTDSRTLYYASNGIFGLGGFDIFYSRYLGNGIWSTPENVGYPLNTAKDDLAFIVTTNGEKIFFSSQNTHEKTGWDIYQSDLHSNARPDRVLFVKGGLFDTDGKNIKNASVELQSLMDYTSTEGMVDANDGKYAVARAVRKNEEFILTVRKKNRFFNSKYIKPNEQILRNPPLQLNINASDLKIGTTIRLDNIYFEVNSAKFDSISILTLKYFAGFMKSNSGLKIEIHGHTDNQGSFDFNVELSTKRAKAVRDFLIKQGINSSRVKYKGFGETKPIESNATRKGRAANRRTEFIILEK